MAFNKARALQEADRLAAQGKLSQAIQQYLVITENDPRDLALLNSTGDLCVRDRNIPEALRLFRRLADAYAREGFTLKAIAIYRKLSKLDPNNIEPVLKLAELYAAQGLSREALGLYAEALQSAEKANRRDQALDIMRRIVAGDPENDWHAERLADCLAAAGNKTEAARVYVQAAQGAARRGDREGAGRLLARAREFDASAAGLTEADISPAEPAPQPASPQQPSAVAAPEAPSESAAGEAEPPPQFDSAPRPEVALSSPRSTPLAGEDESPSIALPGVAPSAPSAYAVAREFDLSGEWEALAAGDAAAAVETPLFDEEESQAEVEFYLSTGMFAEARRAVGALEEQFSHHPQVVELRRRVEQATAEPAEGALAPSGAAQPSSVAAGRDLLQGLAADLESHWMGIDSNPPDPSTRPASPPRTANASTDFAAALGALLDDLNEEAKQEEAPDDPETHYGLGIAFREMGLVEEAIGEFQKAVKLTPTGERGAQLLQACTFLGVCFMERQLPVLAAKWYRRALEAPEVGEDTRLALEYDLGMAYERAGDSQAALDRYLEVYSQNVDYRDVAEKVRLLGRGPA